MTRLPTPGQDAGAWGQILNDYLSAAHKADGTLKDNAVTGITIANDSVTEANLAPEVVDKLNSAGVSSVATLTGDITSPDLVDALETDLRLQYAPVAGSNLTASGEDSWAEGRGATASGNNSHAEGFRTTASTTGAPGAHAEGANTEATFYAAHAEGDGTRATHAGAHAEGMTTTASAAGSHAEGSGTVASSPSAHAEGSHTTASGTKFPRRGSRYCGE